MLRAPAGGRAPGWGLLSRVKVGRPSLPCSRTRSPVDHSFPPPQRVPGNELEWFTGMHLAFRSAPMRPVRPMNHCGLAIAVIAAPTQFGVEVVENLGLEFTPIQFTDCADAWACVRRGDMFADIAFKCGLGSEADICLSQMLTDQITQRCISLWLPILRDLPDEPGTCFLRKVICVRSCRDDFAQIEALAGQHVYARVHPHPQRPARQRLNIPPWTLPPRRVPPCSPHRTKVRRVHHGTSHDTELLSKINWRGRGPPCDTDENGDLLAGLLTRSRPPCRCAPGRAHNRWEQLRPGIS